MSFSFSLSLLFLFCGYTATAGDSFTLATIMAALGDFLPHTQKTKKKKKNGRESLAEVTIVNVRRKQGTRAPANFWLNGNHRKIGSGGKLSSSSPWKRLLH